MGYHIKRAEFDPEFDQDAEVRARAQFSRYSIRLLGTSIIDV